MTPGTKLGPYEILAAVGAGGMGEVYRARDTRLDRTVAIKILPDHASDRAELRERFEREARTELLEGETLAQRLRKGPLPLDQVMRYAIRIGEHPK